MTIANPSLELIGAGVVQIAAIASGTMLLEVRPGLDPKHVTIGVWVLGALAATVTYLAMSAYLTNDMEEDIHHVG